jgi:hypothetical protein
LLFVLAVVIPIFVSGLIIEAPFLTEDVLRYLVRAAVGLGCGALSLTYAHRVGLTRLVMFNAPDLGIARLVDLSRNRGGQRALLAFDQWVQEVREGIIELSLGNKVREQSYRDQMTYALFFYRAHESRFWATSLDRWIQYYRSNEAYLAAMVVSGEQRLSPSGSSTASDGPPPRARILVQSWAELVRDFATDETAATSLVDMHVRAWGVAQEKSPIRIFFTAKEVDDVDQHLELVQMVSERLHEDGVSRPASELIPDFMVVDDQFVYGRQEPYTIPDSLPIDVRDVVLRFVSDRTEVDAYAHVFSWMWSQSYEADALYWDLYERGDPELRLALDRALVELPELGPPADVEAAFRATLERVAKLLIAERSDAERSQMYGVVAEAESKDLVKAFARHYIEQGDGLLIAVDTADVKQADRFWQVWRNQNNYRVFDDATRRRPGRALRVFVVRTWSQLDSEAALEFIRSQLDGGVRVGLILEEDLARIGQASHGRQSVVRSVDAASPRLAFDSDFIIADVRTNADKWDVQDETRGFELRNRSFEEQRTGSPAEMMPHSSAPSSPLRASTVLMLPDRMDGMITWFQSIWDSEHCICPETMLGFEQRLAALVSKDEHVAG